MPVVSDTSPRQKMKKKPISKKSGTDFKRLDAMTDADIDLSDIPEVTPEMFAKGTVRHGLMKKDIYHAIHSDLIAEFTNYLITHPRFKLPLGVEVILLDCQDAGYTRYMLKCAPKKKTGENVVFLGVGELAPIRSRIKKPTIISRETAKKVSAKKKPAPKTRKANKKSAR